MTIMSMVGSMGLGGGGGGGKGLLKGGLKGPLG